LGFVFNILGEVVYAVLMNISVDLGAHSERNPALWIARGLAW